MGQNRGAQQVKSRIIRNSRQPTDRLRRWASLTAMCFRPSVCSKLIWGMVVFTRLWQRPDPEQQSKPVPTSGDDSRCAGTVTAASDRGQCPYPAPAPSARSQCPPSATVSRATALPPHEARKPRASSRQRSPVRSLYELTRLPDAEVVAQALIRQVQNQCPEYIGEEIWASDLEQLYVGMCAGDPALPLLHWTTVGEALSKLTRKRRRASGAETSGARSIGYPSWGRADATS